jgi:hypothetical protein
MIQTAIRMFLIGLVAIAGIAQGSSLPTDEGESAAYVMEGAEGLLARFAPVFIVEHNEQDHNKIGTPTAERNMRGKEKVSIDSSQPIIYTQVETFATERDNYNNLIYRIHFEANPFTLVPLNVGAGKNVGALAVVTLNSQEEPVWLTTVQSCGCYHAIIPTDYLADEAYPTTWDRAGQTVYGEALPGVLSLKANAANDPHIAITIRGDSHRCKNVTVKTSVELDTMAVVVPAKATPVSALKSLSLPDGSETSFYHTKGHRKGLVKGAYKPLETLLFGLWAWDHNVGQDREYGSKKEVGRRFYTTLFFPRKKKADMWHFARYLEHNGWAP